MGIGLDDAVVGWLVSGAGNALVGKLTNRQKKALRRVVDTALEATAREVVAHHPKIDPEHLLTALRVRDLEISVKDVAAEQGWSAALRTWVREMNTRKSSSWVGYLQGFGIDPDDLCDKLISNIANGIENDGLVGGALKPVADHRGRQELSKKIDELAETIEDRNRVAAAELGYVPQDPRQIFALVGRSPFSGRQWLIDKVAEFIEKRECGFVWVEAEAGLGKTTFAAHLVRTRRYLSHFTRLPGGSHPPAALRSLAAQLIVKYEMDPVVPAVVQTPEGFANLLQHAADRAAERGSGPVVLVVDGLDEADDDGGFALGLPPVLPSGVFVVGTYRTGRRPAEPESESETVRIDPGGEDNRADIATFLDTVVANEDIAAGLREHGIPAEDFTAKLADKCGGVWIYLHYVLEEIRRGHRIVAEVDDLPTGILGFYMASIDRWRNGPDRNRHPDWAATRLPVLATLAAAAEPTTVDALAELSGARDPNVVRDLCDETFRSFLAVTDGKPRRYAIYHASFREFLHGTLPVPHAGTHPDKWVTVAEELGEHTRVAHKLMCAFYLGHFGSLEHGLPTLAGNPRAAGIHDGYPLRHLAYHLAHTGREQDLHKLLACEFRLVGGQASNVWFAAHELAGSVDEYLGDLERARDLATNGLSRNESGAEALGAEVRYDLMAASVHSMTDGEPDLVAQRLASGVWDVTHAVGHIKAQRDPLRRAQVTARVAPHLPMDQRADLVAGALAAAYGSAVGTDRTFALLTLTPDLTDYQRAQVVDTILAEVRSGRMADRTITELLAEMAPVLRPEQWPEAVATAGGLNGAAYRAEAATALVPYLSGEPLVDAVSHALDAAPRIRDERTRKDPLIALLPHLDPGRLGEVLTLTHAFRNTSARRNVLAAMLPYVGNDQRPAILDEVLGEATLGAESAHVRYALLLTSLRDTRTDDQFRHAITSAQRFATPTASVSGGDAYQNDEGPWNFSRLRAALAAAEAVNGLPSDTESLAALVPHLDAAAVRSVATTTSGLPDARMRTDVLTVLFPYLDDGDLTSAIQHARTSHPLQRDQLYRTKTLVGLTKHVTADEFRDAVNTARRALMGATTGARSSRWEPDQVEQRWYTPNSTTSVHTDRDEVDLPAGLSVDQLRAMLAAAEFVHLTPGSTDTLARMASHLASDVLPSLTEAAHAIDDSGARSAALTALLPYLDDDQLPRAVKQILATTDRSSRPRSLTLMLDLAPHLTVEQIRHATRAAQAADPAGWKWDRTEQRWHERASINLVTDLPELVAALAALARHLPDAQRERIANRALEVLDHIDSVDDSLRALEHLGPVLTLDRLHAKLRTALKDNWLTTAETSGIESMATLAPLLPPDLDTTLQDQAITASRRGTHALSSVAPLLPDTRLRTVVANSLATTELDDRLGRLAALAPHLADDLAGDAFHAAQTNNVTIEKVMAPDGPIPANLVGPLSDHALGRDPSRHDGPADERSQLLAQAPPELRNNLVEFLDAAAAMRRHGSTLATLVTSLPDAERRSVRDHSLTAPPTYFGALVLAELAPELSGPQLHQAVTAARAVADVDERAHLLTKLAPHLPAHERDAAITATGVLAAQADALTGLVPHLSPTHHSALLARTRKSLAQGNPYTAAILLSALLPYVPTDERESVVHGALTAIPRAADIYYRNGYHGIAGALLNHAAKISAAARTASETAMVYDFWRSMLRNRTRAYGLTIIEVMAPWLAAQGGAAAVEECVSAIDDITTWWP